MRSYEVLKRAADTVGVKALAAELKLSTALVYKWCQPSDPNDPDASGARNPLDRLADIIRVTGDVEVANWLCRQAGGYYVPNPDRLPDDVARELLVNTQRMVTEFSEFLLTVTRSIEDDGLIEPAESDRIRDRWELFKSMVEAFTVACERGLFHRIDTSNK
jgi:hypothetical protein